MKHRPNKQALLLYQTDEMTQTERTRLERHLRTCVICRTELDALRRFHAVIAEHKPMPGQETSIASFRNDVMRTIRSQKNAVPLTVRLREFLGFAEGSGLRPALTLALVAILVFLVARFFESSTAPNNGNFAPIAYDPYRSESSGSRSGDSQVLNVQITSKDEVTGDIEFDVEVLLVSHVAGNMHDPGIQSILARALVSSQNPAVRLRAATAFNEAATDNVIADRSRDLVKESLISALLHDKNHGVRLQALSALEEFMPDSAATSAVLRVLTTDKNSAMKIAAINSLDLSKYGDGATRNRLSSVLRDRSLNDDNNYIRIKAKSALQEVLQ